uniref:Conserved domain protein n=1 Tax=Ascaris lumbricoides TaxID=6252 RepID=A0A0M3HT17_ASCLU
MTRTYLPSYKIAARQEVRNGAPFMQSTGYHEATPRKTRQSLVDRDGSSCVLFAGHRLPTGDARRQSGPE